MVRTYKKKTNQHSWSMEAMEKAVHSVVSGEMGYKKSAQSHAVPQTTLERYVTKYRANPDSTVFIKKLGHYTTVFSSDQEKELISYIKIMEERFYGLTSQELRKLAFSLAEKNKIEHRFNTQNGLAGIDWLKGFLKRHRDISYRKPEPTSAARAMGFNRVAVGNFLDLLEKIYNKHNLNPQRIFNVDETGVSTVPKSHSKILASCGKRQVGTMTSAERGKLMTTIVCFSAVGNYMPPMFIFPRKRMKPELLDGAPAGSWGECHESGWIQSHLFVLWLKRFIEWSHAIRDDPVLLLLDGHATHVKSLEVIDMARNNGVILLCFPPHCTHRLQPLDVGFMKPLSTYYGNEVKKWLRCHPGRGVTQFQMATLFGLAFVAAATMTTAINAYRATGIWPMDRNVFTDADFAPAETTNNPQYPKASNDPQNISQVIPLNVNETPPPTGSATNLSTREQRSPESRQGSPQPGCSWMNNPPKSSFLTSPEQIMPLPKENRTTQRVVRRRGKTAILTESPYKNELAALKATKESKEMKRKVTKSIDFSANKPNKKRNKIVKTQKKIKETVVID